MRLVAAVVCLCALVLTACGADVNSQLEFEEDFSGTRTFVLTMADDDVEALSGGIEAAENALEAHTPEVLVFDGIEQRDEGYSAAFDMPFDDLEDYQSKITSLLDASGVPQSERDMSIELDEQQLLTTLSFQESFYNDDLMGWAADALLTEQVVTSDTTILTSNGTATVIFDGEEIDTSTSLPRMNFTLTDDRRFDDVGLDVEFLESGEFRISMAYLISADSARAQNDFLTQQVAALNDLDGLTEPVTDSGATDPASDDETRRRISAQFSSPESLARGMQILLANEDASFEVQEASDTDSPDVITQYRGVNWTCEEICNPDNLQQLDGETIHPEHWQVVEERREDGEFFVELNRGMPLQEMTAATRLTFDGRMEQTFEFVVNNATQEGHEDTVADKFAPPANTGSFQTAVQGDKTVYTTTFRAENAQELTTMINAYLTDKGVEKPASISHEPMIGIWAAYELNVDLSPIWEVATGGVEETTVFSVELPSMHSGHSDTTNTNERTILIEDSAGTFTIHANGPTITTIWVAVLTVLFLTVLVVLLIRTRRATTRVWSVASARPNGPKPYNVQGPKDHLTETEIFQAPPASIDNQSTARTPSGRETTSPLGEDAPFPDVPVPSHTQYQQLQDRLRQKRMNAGSTEPEDDSEDPPDNSESRNPSEPKSED